MRDIQRKDIDGRVQNVDNVEEVVRIITTEIKQSIGKYASIKITQQRRKYNCRITEDTKQMIRRRNNLRKNVAVTKD